MNDAKTDAILVSLSKLERAAKYLRKTHDYQAWIPTDRTCEGCEVILDLESAIGKLRHALEGKDKHN